ncbi:uncharacterized protein LOC132255488 [Phlebotomus argentipes]|uniref:uncharacterized protein LOC132255488 n=1 Tax=Phlebotomus argentipes TaxID=94469 RepID=UPI002892C727|nr:uncharacterized protein LOC132255488 [Phlebotomus argentipes]
MANNAFDPSYFAALAQSMKKREETREKERRDLQQQEEIKTAIHAFLGAHEIELLIREFNPAKNPDLYASEWINEIELLGIIHKWEPYHLLLYASMRLSGVARTWYEYSLDSISDWDDFKQELINNFPRSIDAGEVHSRLMVKKRGANEMLEDYFHNTVKLAKRIKMDDDSIKDYLIRGLTSPKHQVILSAVGSCSLTEFLQHMQRLEIDTRSPRRQSPQHEDSRDRSRERAFPPQRRHYSPDRTSSEPKRVRRDKECHLCGSHDHLAAQCKSRSQHFDRTRSKEVRSDQHASSRRSSNPGKRICYNCKKGGHEVLDCPMPRQPQHNSDRKKHHYGQRRGKYDDSDSEIDLDAVNVDNEAEDDDLWRI